jgi:hypothetical protein
MKRRRMGIVEVLRGDAAEVSHHEIGFVDKFNCAFKRALYIRLSRGVA